MSSYVLEGQKWSTGTITWSFAAQTLARDADDAFSTTMTDTASQAMVERALARWQTVSGLNFIQVADSQASDIRFGWGALGDTASGEIGDTTYYSSGRVMQPDVVIRLEDPQRLALVPSAAGPTYNGTLSTLYQVMLHEIGHAIGLDHNADPASIMYAVAGTGNRDLDQTDIAGVQSLYGAPVATAVTASILGTPAPQMTTTGGSPNAVHFHGDHTQYTIVAASGGAMQISDTVAGRDGMQTIGQAGDLVFADGQGRFDADGAAEDIYRLYSAALGRAADAGGLDYWVSAREGGASMSTIAGGLANSAEFLAHTGALTDKLYVQALYDQVLGHAGDAGGAAYWTQLLDRGASRGDVLLSFADSDEERARVAGVAGDADDARAARLYQAAFGHAPDQGGQFYWSDMMRQGMTPSAVARAFLASSEHAQIYGGTVGDQGFVASLYQNALGRAADAGGLSYWAGQLAAGATRADIMAGFADSTETRTLTASATHANWVFLG